MGNYCFSNEESKYPIQFINIDDIDNNLPQVIMREVWVSKNCRRDSLL